jgi:hypothetical protein
VYKNNFKLKGEERKEADEWSHQDFRSAIVPLYRVEAFSARHTHFGMGRDAVIFRAIFLKAQRASTS